MDTLWKVLWVILILAAAGGSLSFPTLIYPLLDLSARYIVGKIKKFGHRYEETIVSNMRDCMLGYSSFIRDKKSLFYYTLPLILTYIVVGYFDIEYLLRLWGVSIFLSTFLFIATLMKHIFCLSVDDEEFDELYGGDKEDKR